MNKIIFTQSAELDVQEIVGYISERNPDASRKIYNKIISSARILKESKYVGVVRKDFTDLPLRFLFVDKYAIAYNPDTDPIQIIRVISTERDLQNIL